MTIHAAPSVLAAETEVSTIEAMLASPDFYATRSREFPEWEAKLEAAKAQVASLYARWQELEKIKG